MTWRAAASAKFAGASLADAQKLLGVLQDVEGRHSLPPRGFEPEELAAAPDSFDWRTDPRGARCDSLREIRDQANCGSCWAFGSTEAITDRLCLLANSTRHLSAQDVTSCDKLGDLGCNGGVPPTAYTYYAVDGIVTGGNYGDSTGCYAYALAPCAHHTNSSEYPACPAEVRTPKCQRACDQDSSLDWDADKVYGKRGYSICQQSDARRGDDACAEKMKAEIYANGPITAAFFVHEDFLNYQSGVYQSTKLSPMLGGHAIKILGYGTQDDTPYWIVANSWNEDWGDNGYFKILRGSNECQIEDPVINGGPVAGLPSLPGDPSFEPF